MNRHRITTSRRVGEPSSKYGYDQKGKQFDRDMERHQQESEALYQDFREWMMERKVDPEKLRYLFLRLWEEFLDGANNYNLGIRDTDLYSCMHHKSRD